ncbi:hypothetical protein GCM10007989_04520 [Devosia pacifica]|uniref:Uncharacterized protein n=1 Tax=Devosia pacifica TaxID=1335967 RepID=A0A918VPA1_9HYPH|nr:hypothetical protein [Devosia pacifica]GHA13054.1 hypothetical protein GCM10007989_04520 [Devosia pacifica]
MSNKDRQAGRLKHMSTGDQVGGTKFGQAAGMAKGNGRQNNQSRGRGR